MGNTGRLKNPDRGFLQPLEAELLHHGLNSFCSEPTGVTITWGLRHRITCANYQPHTKPHRFLSIAEGAADP
jgi:hypothetical protein